MSEITAPFSEEEIQRLNEYQTSTGAREAFADALPKYQALADQGALGADVMVACLLRRQVEMEQKDLNASR